MKFDVAVIGGGMAGTVAALAAARQGKKVAVISAGWGATASSSGAWDLWDISGIFTTRDQYLKLLAESSAHPYYRLAQESGGFSWEKLLALGKKATEFLLPQLAAVGLPYQGTLEDNLILGRETGYPKPSNFAPVSSAVGDLKKSADKKVLLIGLKGLGGDFHAAFLAKLWEQAVKKKILPPLKTAATEIELETLKGRLPLGALEAARNLDLKATAEEFMEKVIGAASKESTALVALPPILGIHNTGALRTALQAGGVTGFELLAAPPSAPGHRLQSALERMLTAAGVTLLRARINGFSAVGDRVETLKIAAASGTSEIYGAELVLAAGKFLGGGLRFAGEPKESIFGLPLYLAARPITAAYEFPLLNPRFAERQEIFSLGVAIDRELKPLNVEGRPAFVNLRAAGGMLGGYDPWRDGSGMGVPLISGWAAGLLAAGVTPW